MAGEFEIKGMTALDTNARRRANVQFTFEDMLKDEEDQQLAIDAPVTMDVPDLGEVTSLAGARSKAELEEEPLFTFEEDKPIVEESLFTFEDTTEAEGAMFTFGDEAVPEQPTISPIEDAQAFVADIATSAKDVARQAGDWWEKITTPDEEVLAKRKLIQEKGLGFGEDKPMYGESATAYLQRMDKLGLPADKEAMISEGILKEEVDTKDFIPNFMAGLKFKGEGGRTGVGVGDVDKLLGYFMKKEEEFEALPENEKDPTLRESLDMVIDAFVEKPAEVAGMIARDFAANPQYMTLPNMYLVSAAKGLKVAKKVAETAKLSRAGVTKVAKTAAVATGITGLAAEGAAWTVLSVGAHKLERFGEAGLPTTGELALGAGLNALIGGVLPKGGKVTDEFRVVPERPKAAQKAAQERVESIEEAIPKGKEAIAKEAEAKADVELAEKRLTRGERKDIEAQVREVDYLGRQVVKEFDAAAQKEYIAKIEKQKQRGLSKADIETKARQMFEQEKEADIAALTAQREELTGKLAVHEESAAANKRIVRRELGLDRLEVEMSPVQKHMATKEGVEPTQTLTSEEVVVVKNVPAQEKLDLDNDVRTDELTKAVGDAEPETQSLIKTHMEASKGVTSGKAAEAEVVHARAASIAEAAHKSAIKDLEKLSTGDAKKIEGLEAKISKIEQKKLRKETLNDNEKFYLRAWKRDLRNAGKANKKATEVAEAKRVAALEAKQKHTEAASKAKQEATDNLAHQVDASSGAASKAMVDLAENRKLSDKVIKGVANAITKPVAFGLIAGATTTAAAAYDEDLYDNVLGNALAASAFALAHKSISKIPTIKTKQRETFTQTATRNVINNYNSFWTPGTNATKLNSRGGTTEDVSHQLYDQVNSQSGGAKLKKEDSVMTRSNFAEVAFTRDAMDTFKGVDLKVREEAADILMGITKEGSAEAKKVAKGMRKWMDEYSEYHAEVGIQQKQQLENFFFRKYNQQVTSDKAELLQDIFTQAELAKNPKLTEAQARAAAQIGADQVRTEGASGKLFRQSAEGVHQRTSNKLAAVRHIETARKYHGDIQWKGETVNIDKILRDEGFVVKDPQDVMLSIINESTRSVEMARTYGKNLTGLHNQLKKIDNEFGAGTAEAIAAKQDVIDSVNAIFGQYGESKSANFANSVAVVQLGASIQMIPDVVLKSLGEIFQPVASAHNFKAVQAGIKSAKLKATKHEGLQTRAMAYEYSQAIEQNIHEMMGMNTGQLSDTMRGATRRFYRTIQLDKWTSVTRRISHDMGVENAFQLAQSLTDPKIIKNTRKHRLNLNDANEMGMSVEDAQRLSAFRNSEEAANADPEMSTLLSRAGYRAAERDVLLAGPGNRRLWVQSRNPAMKALGQFTSWAQARASAVELNLQKIENGDMRKAVGLVAMTGIAMAVDQFVNAYRGTKDQQLDNIQGAVASGIITTGAGGFIAPKFVDTVSALSSFGESPVNFPGLGFFKNIYQAGEYALDGEGVRAVHKLIPPSRWSFFGLNPIEQDKNKDTFKL